MNMFSTINIEITVQKGVYARGKGERIIGIKFYRFAIAFANKEKL